MDTSRYIIATKSTLANAIAEMRAANVWSNSYGLVPGLHNLTDDTGATMTIRQLRRVERERPYFFRAVLVCTGIDFNTSYDDGRWWARAKVTIVNDDATYAEIKQAAEDNTGRPWIGTAWESIVIPPPEKSAAAVLGRRGGSVISAAKAAAARANGRKGGRPRKPKTSPLLPPPV
jgi:hypothetical protein